MKTSMLRGGAYALSAIFWALPAHAQQDDSITVEGQLLKPAAGLMNDHMHSGGEAMIGLRFERDHHAGVNRSGTNALSDAAILAASYSTRAWRMDMDMLMLDLMMGVSDKLTVMAMPHYMWHRMEMVGIDPAMTGGMAGGHGSHSGGHGSHAGGAIPFGQTHEHATEGFGDTLVSASYRLARGRGINAHATLGLWVPTGSVGRKNPDGSFVHYGMQPGSGTWDVEPQLTVSGKSGVLGWGGQASYRWRTENANESGFAFGDKTRATGWLSYLVAGDVGATARLAYEHEGPIEGHYNAGHNHAAPPDRQANYGGDIVSAAVGFNWLLPVGGGKRPQLGIEAEMPLYQDLHGIQLPRQWGLSVGLSKAF